MKIGLSENFTAKVTNALKESEKTKKTMKEDSYDETFFSDIEDALRNAGFDVTRFTDAGILTKNLGWVVENSEGEVQLSCDGTWLDENLKEADDFVVDSFDKVGGDVKYILDGIDKLRKGLHSYESEKILDTILERVPGILQELGYTWDK